MAKLTDKNGKAVRLSHSTIETHELCNRKCYFNKHRCLRKPSGPKQKAGTDVHSIAEAYLRGEPLPKESEELDYSPVEHEDGTVTTYLTDKGFIDPDNKPEKHLPLAPEAMAIFATGRDLLPEPGTVSVEEWCRVEILPGVQFVGKVDFHRVDIPIPFVADHKTRSRINSSYVPGDFQLAQEAQPLRYAYALLHKNPPERVNLVHVNYQRTPPYQANMVQAVVDDQEGVPWSYVQEEWDRTVAIAQDIVDKWSQALTPDDIPHSAPTACRAYYTDCEYSSICSAHPSAAQRKVERFMAKRTQPKKKEGTMGILDALKKNIPAETTPAKAPAPAAPVAPATPVVKEASIVPPDRPTTMTEAQAAVADLRKMGAGDKQVQDALGKLGVPEAKWPQAMGTPAHLLGYDPGQIARMTTETRARIEVEGIPANTVSISKKGGIIELDGPIQKGPPVPQMDDAPWAAASDDYRKGVAAVIVKIADKGPISIDSAFDAAKKALDWGRITARRQREFLEECEKCGVFQEGGDLVRVTADEPEPVEEQRAGLKSVEIVTEATEKDAAKVAEAVKALVNAKPSEVREATGEILAESNIEEKETPMSTPLVIYVDCYPEGAPVQPTRWESWVAPHIEAVETQLGGQFYSVPDYNEGEKRVIARVQAALVKQEANPWPGGLYIRTGTKLAEMAIELLARAEGAVFVRVAR